MRLFQAALDICLDSPFLASLSVHGLWESAKVSHKRVFALLTPEIPHLEMAQMLQKPVFALLGCQPMSVNTLLCDMILWGWLSLHFTVYAPSKFKKCLGNAWKSQTPFYQTPATSLTKSPSTPRFPKECAPSSGKRNP